MFLLFERCFTIVLWHRVIIYMHTSFTGYADDIFNVISNFDIQRFRKDLAEKQSNLAYTQKKIELRRVHGAPFFQLQGTLDT